MTSPEYNYTKLTLESVMKLAESATDQELFSTLRAQNSPIVQQVASVGRHLAWSTERTHLVMILALIAQVNRMEKLQVEQLMCKAPPSLVVVTQEQYDRIKNPEKISVSEPSRDSNVYNPHRICSKCDRAWMFHDQNQCPEKGE